MSQELEARANALCRDVGHATMLVGALPGLGAVTGLLVMPLVEPDAPVKWAPALGMLALAGALGFLGYALRARKPWSFLATKVLFIGLAVTGFIALVMNDESEKIAVALAVALPLGFVAGASKAARAVEEAERARADER